MHGFMSKALWMNRGLHHFSQMCVVSFTILDIEMAVGIAGDDISLAVIADHVIPREYGNIAVDKFQTKYASGGWLHECA